MRNLCASSIRRGSREELCKLNREKRVIVNFLPNKITGGGSYCRFIDFQRAQWEMNLSPFPFSWLGIDSILQWIATKLKKLRGKGLSNWPPELPFRIIGNFNGNNSNDMIPSLVVYEIRLKFRPDYLLLHFSFLTYLSN